MTQYDMMIVETIVFLRVKEERKKYFESLFT